MQKDPTSWLGKGTCLSYYKLENVSFETINDNKRETRETINDVHSINK